MASLGSGTPCFFEKSWNFPWGYNENSSMHFTGQVEQSFNGHSVNGFEPSYGTDLSLMKFALDVSLDLNPKCVIDYLTAQNEPLIADVAPVHLRNDAPSEFANQTPTHTEFSPTADLLPPIVQQLPTGSVTVIEEQNTSAEWLERELRSLGALSDATQFALPASADLQDGFSTVAESAPVESTDYFEQEQVESPPAFNQGAPNEQPIPADVVIVPFFDGQTQEILVDSNQPRPHTTHTEYAEEPLYVYHVEGYGEQVSRHEILQEHVEVHSSDLYANISDEKLVNNQCFKNQIVEKKFACDICNKRFMRPESLQGHMTMHTGEKEFACKICGKNFARDAYLKKHMTIHAKEKNFACVVCNKKFSRHSDLRLHMTVHTGNKTFACNICGKNFARRAYLKGHMAVHNEVKTFTCEICDKKFKGDLYLKQHLRVHNKEKKFTCKVCSEEFEHSIDLKIHMTIHNGEKTFACEICGKNFLRARYLLQHMKVHEEKNDECDICGKRFGSRVQLEIHVVVHTKEKKFACDICDMRFGQKATLTRHRAIHTGVKKFACEICNKEIARYDNLLAHMRTHKNSLSFDTLLWENN